MKRHFFGFHFRDESIDAVYCLRIGDPGGEQPVMIDTKVQTDTLFTHELTAVVAELSPNLGDGRVGQAAAVAG